MGASGWPGIIRWNRVTGSGAAIAVAMRGRRQVGKSRLVQESCGHSGVPYFFFTATKGASPVESVREFCLGLRDSALLAAPDLVPVLDTGSWPDAFRPGGFRAGGFQPGTGTGSGSGGAVPGGIGSGIPGRDFSASGGLPGLPVPEQPRRQIPDLPVRHRDRVRPLTGRTASRVRPAARRSPRTPAASTRRCG